LDFIYDALGLPRFDDDFENVVYEDGGEFDARLGVPGLHLVRGKVKFVDRPTVLPPDPGPMVLQPVSAAPETTAG
jgi:sulfotransferase